VRHAEHLGGDVAAAVFLGEPHVAGQAVRGEDGRPFGGVLRARIFSVRNCRRTCWAAIPSLFRPTTQCRSSVNSPTISPMIGTPIRPTSLTHTPRRTAWPPSWQPHGSAC